MSNYANCFPVSWRFVVSYQPEFLFSFRLLAKNHTLWSTIPVHDYIRIQNHHIIDALPFIYPIVNGNTFCRSYHDGSHSDNDIGIGVNTQTIVSFESVLEWAIKHNKVTTEDEDLNSETFKHFLLKKINTNHEYPIDTKLLAYHMLKQQRRLF